MTIKPKYFIITALLAISIAGNAVTPVRDFFNLNLSAALPAEFRDFANRYLSERIYGNEKAEESARRMKFDEVELSIPLNPSSRDLLSRADGLALHLQNGRRYTITWVTNGVETATMSFPASYNLIRGTTQPESFRRLAERLSKHYAIVASNDTLKTRPTERPDSANLRCKTGTEFYWGHLNSNTFIDAISARPVWSKEFPQQSLANMFLLEEMPDAYVELSMINYNLDSIAINTTLHSLAYLLGTAESCKPYFGITETDPQDGTIHAVVFYHNPTYAYLHKLEITASPKALFESDNPHIRASLQPYIKLHNLKELWGKNYTNIQSDNK